MPDSDPAKHQGQPIDMPGVETNQGGRTGFGSTDHELVETFSYAGDGFQQVCAHYESPADAFIPAQDIAGEIQQQGDHQQEQPQ